VVSGHHVPHGLSPPAAVEAMAPQQIVNNRTARLVVEALLEPLRELGSTAVLPRSHDLI
jgi:hypothetical protein